MTNTKLSASSIELSMSSCHREPGGMSSQSTQGSFPLAVRKRWSSRTNSVSRREYEMKTSANGSDYCGSADPKRDVVRRTTSALALSKPLAIRRHGGRGRWHHISVTSACHVRRTKWREARNGRMGEADLRGACARSRLPIRAAIRRESRGTCRVLRGASRSQPGRSPALWWPTPQRLPPRGRAVVCSGDGPSPFALQRRDGASAAGRVRLPGASPARQ
jgi:hypothetical protein